MLFIEISNFENNFLILSVYFLGKQINKISIDNLSHSTSSGKTKYSISLILYL